MDIDLNINSINSQIDQNSKEVNSIENQKEITKLDNQKYTRMLKKAEEEKQKLTEIS